MASPIATGGAGIHLESHVAAYYLASLLTGGAVRGLPLGVAISKVNLQRAFEQQPLDDVIVQGHSIAGPATLSLQVKRTLVFSENELFAEVLDQCWKTFSSADFREGSYRFGVALGTPDMKVEKAGRNVLTWARESADAIDFFKRIDSKRVASDAMRDFVVIVRKVIEKSAGSPIADDRLWCFLRHFVVLYFDFETLEQSHNLIEVTDRLRYSLPAEDMERSADLWRALVDAADQAKPAAGSLGRPQLIEGLQSEFRFGPLRNLQPDLDRLCNISTRALDDIRSDIGGVYLVRQELRGQIEELLANNRIIEIVGEAGTGKSALAKAIMAQRIDEGPVLVLTAKRMPPGVPGWEGLARHWGLTRGLEELVTDLGCVSSPCLLIDGLDRIEDTGSWLAVNDLLKAIRKSVSASRWTILITARANGLQYRTLLELPDNNHPIARVVVGDLDDQDIAIVASAHPEIAALVAKDGRGHGLASRPYLLSRLVRVGMTGIPDKGPVTEIDLMLQLWKGAGPDNETSDQLILKRQEILLELGHRRLASPVRQLTSRGLPKEALVSLSKDDILRHDTETLEITFAHDVVEDWVLCQSLHHAERPVAEIIQQVGEPLWLIDAVQLLAQWQLERRPTVAEWSMLLREVSQPPLEPRWRRAMLTAPLQSTIASELLGRVNEVLWQEDGRLIGDLMIAMRTVEVEPNPLVLSIRLFPDLDDAARMRLAYDRALPRLRSWLPFFSWLMASLEKFPANLVEGASEVLSLVAQAYDQIPDWAAGGVARWARHWLDHVDPDGEDWNETYDIRRHREAEMNLVNKNEFKKRLRLLILRCAGGAPQEIIKFLQSLLAKPRHDDADLVIKYSNWLVKYIPSELVDFLLAVLLSPGEEEENVFSHQFDAFNRLGIEDDRSFFPASHLHAPFLELMRQSPVDGIRLVNGLCNHAMAQWRNILIREGKGTPLPVRLRFSWGEREFWGHAREYTWNRGIGPGPYTVMSALMALEAWIEEQIAAGRDAEDVFRQVLEGNDCVGTLGACVAVSLANPDKCLPAALPLVCSPQLWYWDILRSVQDGARNANTLGLGLPRYLSHLKDIAKRNQMPHRRKILRDLVDSIIANNYLNSEIWQLFSARMTELQTADLPFEFEEQRTNSSLVADLSIRIRRMTVLADPANYRWTKMEDPSRISIEFIPPPDIAPEPEFLNHYAELEKAMRVALWTEQSLEKNELMLGVSLDEAYAIASALDTPAIFDELPSAEDALGRSQIGAVSGTAALLAKFADTSSPAFQWAQGVLSRAVNAPLDDSPYLCFNSSVMFDPMVNAAAGLTGLLERGFASQQEKEHILALTCHPLLKVKTTLYQGLSRCWEQEPLFCWQCFVLGIKTSVLPWSILNERRGGPQLAYTQGELQWIEAAHDEVLKDFQDDLASQLPRISLPWELINPPSAKPCCRDFKRSEMAFLWHIAPAVLFHLQLAPVMAQPSQRQQLLNLAADLMAWTMMDANPPWGDRHHSSASQWEQEFLNWCGKLTAFLSAQETEDLVISPIANTPRHGRGENLLYYLVQGVTWHRLSQTEIPDNDLVDLWTRLCDIVISHPDADWHAQSDCITSGYGECIAFMIFASYGRAMFDHPWPALPALMPCIEAWVSKFAGSKAYYGQLMIFLNGPGYALLPTPALDWLAEVVEAQEGDSSFWSENDNGERTAQLLARLLDDSSAAVRSEPAQLRQMIRITDILVKHGIRLAAQVMREHF